jgi:hypothetical protein
MRTTVASFYTGTGYYANAARRLASRCVELGIPHLIESVADGGSWSLNSRLKPEFILRMLDRVSGPVLWLDADSHLLRVPREVEGLVCDVAAAAYDGPSIHVPPVNVQAAALFFNNTAGSRRFLSAWQAACQDVGRLGSDHSFLVRVWAEMSDVSRVRLPSAFCHTGGATPRTAILIGFADDPSKAREMPLIMAQHRREYRQHGRSSGETIRSEGDGRARYRVLAYQGTGNLGDAVQTAALSRLLDGEIRGVFRHALRANRTPTSPHDTASFVVNGWLGDIPRLSGRRCLFAGIFLGEHVSNQLRWIADSPYPVGSRDPATHELLKRSGVNSELIGCATLTLDRYVGPRAGRYSVDCVVPETNLLTNVLPQRVTWGQQWGLAVERLAQLRTAEVVFTSRLHVVLPCLAFGTPVVMSRTCLAELSQPERLSLLDEMGFVFDRPCVLDVTPWAERYRGFLLRHLQRPICAGTYRFPSIAPAPSRGNSLTIRNR